jgi:hypothetical protein
MSAVHLDILENFMFPQIVAEVDSLIFKLVPLYAVLRTNHFLVDGSAGEGRLIGLHARNPDLTPTSQSLHFTCTLLFIPHVEQKWQYSLDD